MYKFLCGYMFLVFLGILGRSEFLDHVVIQFNYLKNQQTLPECTIFCSHKQCPGVLIPSHPHQCFLVFVFEYSSPSRYEVISNIVLICITLSLFISDLKNFFSPSGVIVFIWYVSSSLVFIFGIIFSFYFEFFPKFFTSFSSFSWFDLCCFSTSCPVTPHFEIRGSSLGCYGHAFLTYFIVCKDAIPSLIFL